MASRLAGCGRPSAAWTPGRGTDRKEGMVERMLHMNTRPALYLGVNVRIVEMESIFGVANSSIDFD